MSKPLPAVADRWLDFWVVVGERADGHVEDPNDMTDPDRVPEWAVYLTSALLVLAERIRP